MALTAEEVRLREEMRREKNWKRWGPYLAERQWATVREDYSADGDCWNYFPHDHARSRAYRWGEDGLMGVADRECRLCFALALWNHKDPILKERLFGLTGPEGNHGEDVKELYYYLDSTPTHTYMKALYKYPQAAFPYNQLVEENRRRTRADREFELVDTGVFEQEKYFDVQVEYAKVDTDDLLIKVTVSNRGAEAAPLTLLPTVWFRNTWSWGAEDAEPKPMLRAVSDRVIEATHSTLGTMYFVAEPGGLAELIFTENETNEARLYGQNSVSPYVKDAFDRAIVHGETGAVNPAMVGTKGAAVYRVTVGGGGQVVLRFRLTNSLAAVEKAFEGFESVFAQRLVEADAFYAEKLKAAGDAERRNVARQAYAGILWSKQFYNYVVQTWRHGDPKQYPPPRGHSSTRNSDWKHLYSRDVISMPDAWEYPWFAAWDLAFHMVALAKVDGTFAKGQLELLLREWYMHPNGQIPAYEFAFSDVNPPVHAWAVWRVYKMTGPKGKRDTAFLERCFHKLMLNFTWWVNRKDVGGKHLFSGGFLGLDNIGIFDRSKPLPNGHVLEQADGTAWMAFYCSTMLAMALELSVVNPAYEDIASKFFEHFVAIVDAINTVGGTGLWNEKDGFYYDQLWGDGKSTPLRVRSLVGIVPLFAAEIFEKRLLDRLPGFTKRMQWFLEHRKDLAKNIAYMERAGGGDFALDPHGHFLLAVPSKERLERVLGYLMNEGEFLSGHGVRSVSKVHEKEPFVLQLNGEEFSCRYCPGESDTPLFGGNSNWRGPVWMPMNYLLLEALERYEHFYGDTIKIRVGEKEMTIGEAVDALRGRLAGLFLPDGEGRRPCHGGDVRYQKDPHWRELVLFHEYFHGETGEGLGASHQTGWTALVVHLLGTRQVQTGKGWK